MRPGHKWSWRMLLAPVVLLALCAVSAGEEDVSALVQKLKDKDKEVRRKAASTLGAMGLDAEEAVPALIEAFKDQDEDVRGSAADALGKIGPAAEEAVPALIAARKDADKAVRFAAELALYRIRGEG